MSLKHGVRRRPGHQRRDAYHVISNELKMSYIDIYLVCTEDTSDFTQDGCACHLYAVGFQNRVDVVRVDCIMFDDTVVSSISELPNTTEIGSIGGQLYRGVNS